MTGNRETVAGAYAASFRMELDSDGGAAAFPQREQHAIAAGTAVHLRDSLRATRGAARRQIFGVCEDEPSSAGLS